MTEVLIDPPDDRCHARRWRVSLDVALDGAIDGTPARVFEPWERSVEASTAADVLRGALEFYERHELFPVGLSLKNVTGITSSVHLA